jgi:sugar phosphate isomerase/epimerase
MLKNVVGAQLYTCREFCQTAEGIRESVAKVAKIGYTVVQLSGLGPMSAKDVAKVCADNGLTIASTHENWERFLTDLDALIEEHKIYNCQHLAIGGIFRGYEGLDGVKRFADDLAPVAARLAQEGMDFSYHNHNHEFAKHDGKVWLEALYETIPGDVLKAEIDTYWVQAGGGDPALWVEKMAGREPLLHLKDMALTPEREQRYAEVGEGNLNWPRIMAAAKKAGVEYYFVEQDRCYDRSPFESLAISYRNLNAMGLS